MWRERILCIVAPLLLFCGGGASATEAPDPGKVPALKQLLEFGSKLVFLERRSGLDGWFAIKDGKGNRVYTTADGQLLIDGDLYGTDGRNVTLEQLQAARAQISAATPQLAPSVVPVVSAPPSPTKEVSTAPQKPSPGKAGELLWTQLESAAWVSTGDRRAPILYMVVDPECGYCKSAWQDLRAALKSGQVQIRLVPVGLLTEESPRLAGRLLEVTAPEDAWDQLAQGDATSLSGEPKAESAAALLENRKLMAQWNMRVTPFLVYKSATGSVRVVSGEPRSAQDVLRELRGQ